MLAGLFMRMPGGALAMATPPMRNARSAAGESGVPAREAMLAQLPMLALMVAYTVLGLWVISLPFALISATHPS